ncbi:MAG: hypothetical protein R3B58_00630 [Phycisphaerales bacterium]
MRLRDRNRLAKRLVPAGNANERAQTRAGGFAKSVPVIRAWGR